MDIKSIFKAFGKEEVRSAVPKNYKKVAEIEAKTLKHSLILLGVGLAAAATVFAVGCLIVPITEFFDVSGVFVFILRLLVIAALAYAYFWSYEKLYAAVLVKLCGVKPMRMNAELRLFYHVSEHAFEPKAFFIVKFAPTVIIFAVLLLLDLLLPRIMFWEVYIIQIINLSCAAPYYCLAAILIRSKKKKVLISENDDCIELWAADS